MIDVAGGRDRFPAQLLGAGVLRGQATVHRSGLFLGDQPTARREDLGDAEVEQLHLPATRDQDVRGFEVAVDDQVPVRVLDGVDHRDGELETLVEIQAMVVRGTR